MSNYAQIITTGPAHIFIGQRTLASIATPIATSLDTFEYLGTCQKSPEINIETLKEEVVNDIGGDTPISFAHQGQVGTVKALLNRYDEAIYAKIAVGLYGSGLNRGEITRNQMGVLAQGMHFDFEILFYFPFHQSFNILPANTTSHPEGVHFVSAVPVKEKLMEMGTRARTLEIEFKCIPKMQMSTTNLDSNGLLGPTCVREFVLYKHLNVVTAALKGKVN